MGRGDIRPVRSQEGHMQCRLYEYGSTVSVDREPDETSHGADAEKDDWKRRK